MTRPQDTAANMPARPRTTGAERAFVLGGFAVAALWTGGTLALDTGLDSIGALWLVAILWTVPASLAVALRRGFRDRDWSAFRRYELPDGRDERMDWATGTGSYAWQEIAEEHERLMRSD